MPGSILLMVGNGEQVEGKEEQVDNGEKGEGMHEVKD